MTKYLKFAFLAFAGQSLMAQLSFSAGLVIHTTEWGVGKFHRIDNHYHAYGQSDWLPYVLAPNLNAGGKALTQKNADGSFTVFFSTLDEMIESVTAISESEKTPVEVLNVHGHGLPGAMWFPKDADALASWACASWVGAANGSDDDNYAQYYSPVSVNDIETIRSFADNPNVKTPCTTGVNEWRAALQKYPKFKGLFAADSQIHFLSCVVGLGTMGDAFTKGIAELLLPASSKGRVETSMNFGLGDWSMPQGMGFWDYQTADQVERDDQKYAETKTDRDIAQKGSIRVASYTGTALGSSVVGNLDHMAIRFETKLSGQPMIESEVFPPSTLKSIPQKIRVPGTNVYLDVTH